MRPCAHTLPPPSCSYPFHRYGVHLQGEAQDRMNALMERTQELGMRFTHSVVDPAALGMLMWRDSCWLSGARQRWSALSVRKCKTKVLREHAGWRHATHSSDAGPGIPCAPVAAALAAHMLRRSLACLKELCMTFLALHVRYTSTPHPEHTEAAVCTCRRLL